MAPIARDIIVIGGSAGSLPVLERILPRLPADLCAAVMVVLHQAQGAPGALPGVMRHLGPLRADHAKDGEPIELGRVYVAPPDHHLLVEPGRVRLSRGPKENRFRPAIDPLFRTAARAYGPQVVGVILSGMLDDGTLGLIRVKQFGGVAIAQDPADATSPGMPASAVRHVQCDYVLRADELADVLVRLVAPGPVAPPRQPAARSAAPPASPLPHTASEEASVMTDLRLPETPGTVGGATNDSAERGDNALVAGTTGGVPSALTCPACGGAVWERTENGLVYYRCHVGHAYTADSLAADHEAALEQTLWEALRMFQESAALQHRMARRADDAHAPPTAARFRERAAEAEARAEVVRRVLLGEDQPPPAPARPSVAALRAPAGVDTMGGNGHR